MKKRGYIGRLAAVAMVLCMVTMSLTSGTLAKYASEASGEAKATVAKWAIAFKDKDGEGATTYTDATSFTLNLSDADQESKNLVKTGKIAPGTDGSFSFLVDGTGTEVAYTYTIEVDFSQNADLKKAPLSFYNDADLADTHKISLDGDKITLSGDVLTTETDLKDTATIWWKWDSSNYSETADENDRDTEVGVASAAEAAGLVYEIPVTIKAEQKLTA